MGKHIKTQPKLCMNCNRYFSKKPKWTHDEFRYMKYCSKDCVPTKFSKGNIPWNQGIKNCFSPETLNKISQNNKGKIAWNKNLTNCYSEETLKKMSQAKIGEKNISWKGGKWAYQHIQARKIMETIIGRKLRKDELIHHIDENPNNNGVDNLWLTNKEEHYYLHDTLKTCINTWYKED